MIPLELLENRTLYVELDKNNYSKLQEECEDKISFQLNEGLPTQYSLTSEKVPDIGKSVVLTTMGFRIVCVLNEAKIRPDTFYIAFRTKII